MEELYWIILFWDDVDADYLRYYGVDLETQIDSVASATFFKRAYRLKFIEGSVISYRAQEQAEETKKTLPSHLRNQEVEIVPEKALSATFDDVLDFQ